jgi:hypothetical protein
VGRRVAQVQLRLLQEERLLDAGGQVERPQLSLRDMKGTHVAG